MSYEEEREELEEGVEPEEVVSSTVIGEETSKRRKEMTAYEKVILDLRIALVPYRNINISPETITQFADEFKDMKQILYMNMKAFAGALIIVFQYEGKYGALVHDSWHTDEDTKFNFKNELNNMFNDVDFKSKIGLTPDPDAEYKAKATMRRYIESILLYRSAKKELAEREEPEEEREGEEEGMEGIRRGIRGGREEEMGGFASEEE